MAALDLIVIGASAGGLVPLREIVGSFPRDLAAAVVVVMHVSPTAESVLPAILARAGALPAAKAVDGTRLENGRIYVAPADRHVLLFDGALRVTTGPKVNGHRPSIDALFRSAARWAGPRVMGVVLSGSLDDGASGLVAIRNAGGVTFAQDPSEARYPAMPLNAIERANVEHVLPVMLLGQTIVGLAGQPASEPPAPPADRPADDLELEPEQRSELAGPPSALTCPDCHGALWAIDEGSLVRYRCRVGHAFTDTVLGDRQSDVVEEAMWIAYRALQEKADLSERMARRAERQGQAASARRHQRAHEEADERAKLIHDVLTSGTVGAGDENG